MPSPGSGSGGPHVTALLEGDENDPPKLTVAEVQNAIGPIEDFDFNGHGASLGLCAPRRPPAALDQSLKALGEVP